MVEVHRAPGRYIYIFYLPWVAPHLTSGSSANMLDLGAENVLKLSIMNNVKDHMQPLIFIAKETADLSCV